MSEEKDLIEFDDTEAIRFIMNTLTEEQRKRIDEEAVQYILDLICEYYDQNGLIAEDDIFNFVSSLAAKEQIVALSDEDIRDILDGEYGYGVSIGIYSDED